jgi:hypothetical protein
VPQTRREYPLATEAKDYVGWRPAPDHRATRKAEQTQRDVTAEVLASEQLTDYELGTFVTEQDAVIDKVVALRALRSDIEGYETRLIKANDLKAKDVKDAYAALIDRQVGKTINGKAKARLGLTNIGARDPHGLRRIRISQATRAAAPTGRGASSRPSPPRVGRDRWAI